MKRLVDISISLAALLALSPLMLVIAAVIKATSAGPAFFRQERIGRNFSPFRIYKFRTMVRNADSMGRLLTCGADPRMTRVGRLLRKSKLDELPQLLNVLKGDMSLVGPRPEVGKYVDLFPHEFRELLRVRPGITDLASLKYSNEAALLARYPNPEQVYVERILPDKIRLAKEYLERSSVLFDLNLIARTLHHVLSSRSA